jgi:hypothetical protein
MTPSFVKLIPDALQSNVLYISMEYRTVVHKCCCGCGKEVVTPLSSTGWKLTYDGSAISLYPSIGNWSYDCKSHYWILNNKIVWVKKRHRNQIDQGMEIDAIKERNISKKKNRVLFMIPFLKKNRMKADGIGASFVQ